MRIRHPSGSYKPDREKMKRLKINASVTRRGTVTKRSADQEENILSSCVENEVENNKLSASASVHQSSAFI